jgi:hypothetical protein
MQNAQQPRWIEVGKNNVRSEQTKEEDEDVNSSEHTPTHNPTAEAKYSSAKAAEASSSVAD